MTSGYFFVACCDGHLEHTCGFLRFDHHHGGSINLCPSGVLADVDKSGIYDFIHKCRFDLVHSLLALKRSTEDDWSRYQGE